MAPLPPPSPSAPTSGSPPAAPDPLGATTAAANEPIGPQRMNIARTLAWAVYLACSWTWCIGMFLPVLLVRDYGLWGFVVFAVPNVIGAAALGWVIGNRDRVRTLIERHALAMRAFSWVTILFHVFFLATFGELFGLSSVVLVGVALAIMLGWIAARLPIRFATRIAGLVYVVSVLAFVWESGLPLRPWLEHSESAGISLAEFEALRAGLSDHRSIALVWLAPVCVFGFALCPYLDLTFLKARAELGKGESRWAFTLGFGVFFGAMILGTLWYSPAVFENGRLGFAGNALALHVAGQAMFTVFAHARQAAWIDSDQGDSRPPRLREIGAVACVVIIGAMVVSMLGGTVHTFGQTSDMAPRETAYRYFMSFYGLVFPAYVWLCMIPTSDGHAGIGGPTGRRKLIVLGLVVALASPFFWLGFIYAREHWLGVGLGLVLFSRVLVVSRRPTL